MPCLTEVKKKNNKISSTKQDTVKVGGTLPVAFNFFYVSKKQFVHFQVQEK